jgi:hypothetical protein
MRGALYTFHDPQDQQGELKQQSYHENAHEEGHDSGDEIDQSLRGRLLITEHDASHDRDSAEDDGDHIQQLYKAAKERMMEREIEKPRKEILIFGHAASWAHESIVIAGVVQ